VVVLDELSGQAQRFKLVSPEGFGEKTATVLENPRDEYNDVFQVSGLHSNLHAETLSIESHSPLSKKAEIVVLPAKVYG
jgi:hypothetical protein